MDNYKVEQIWPAHADHISYFKEKDIDQMFLKEAVACQTKYDGERILMHFNNDEVYMTSRRTSKKNNGHYTEVQDNFPCFNDIRLLKGQYEPLAVLDSSYNINQGFPLGYTVLDGELIAEIPQNGKWMNDWSTIVGIIHSLPQRAIELQSNPNVKVKYKVFDCCFFDGQDIRDLPYSKRMNYATRVVEAIKKLYPDERISMVKSTYISSTSWMYEFRDEKIAEGYEGIVVKPVTRKYYDKGMYLKAKRFETKDLAVYDFEQGRGKYSDTVGALKIGYYDPNTNSIVHVTDVNCGTDADRDMWKSWFDEGKAYGVVLEVKCQEVTKNSLRHPVYIRPRPDKDYKMCTKETIFDER